jgi:hypothetical protein
MTTAPKIPLDPTPEERRQFEIDAGSLRVARLAVKKGFTKADWKLAAKAFRHFVTLVLLSGELKKGEGLTEQQAAAWFDSWYLMLTLRRIVAAERNGSGRVPEEDE